MRDNSPSTRPTANTPSPATANRRIQLATEDRGGPRAVGETLGAGVSELDPGDGAALPLGRGVDDSTGDRPGLGETTGPEADAVGLEPPLGTGVRPGGVLGAGVRWGWAVDDRPGLG